MTSASSSALVTNRKECPHCGHTQKHKPTHLRKVNYRRCEQCGKTHVFHPRIRSSASAVLSQMHGVSAEAAEATRKDTIIPISNLVKIVLKSILPPPEKRWETKINEFWLSNENIGYLKKYSQPAKMRGKTLLIKVSNSVWLAEMQRWRKAEILAHIQKKFGKDKIKDISFCPG